MQCNSTKIKFKMIASGSKGNSGIVLSGETKLIIDMGISYLTLKKSLEGNSLSLSDFSGILITHCHKDHTSGLASLLKHTSLKVYIPEEMYESLKEIVPKDNCIFVPDIFEINDTKIELIHTSHDAPYSVGFIINNKDKSIVYITDTGYINRKYLKKMIGKDAYIIESNHDEIMLMDGPYPRFLKERVISDKGHLSNNTTAKYLSKIISNNTKYVVLAHLSETNNREELALNAMKEEKIDKKTTIVIAKQHEETEFMEV